MTPAARKYTQKEVDELMNSKKTFSFDLAWFVPSMLVIIGWIGSFLWLEATLGVRVTHTEEQISSITHEYARKDIVDNNREEEKAQLQEIQQQIKDINAKIDDLIRQQGAKK
jgi:hypothetical protein